MNANRKFVQRSVTSVFHKMFKYFVFFALLAVALGAAYADPAPAPGPKPQIFTSYGAVPLAYSAPYYTGYYGSVIY
ncbi:hypothetical protein NQ315_001003 [Exocentrus adspersus]|uniref:Uncharacterized protein n=1 Tax=Exocentrus adspersus TaxID=1586481 RepID=A0AAV8WE23_9CUCU|nr:hypothetical protein NQ315_001003 [Exocentrus adspersus]